MEVIQMVENAEERTLRIKRLQHNLSTIRKVAGWTTEQMGGKIGVSKQTISNLENGKNPMNFTQYIAIRAILDYEIETNTDNEVLPKVVAILLDSDDDEYKKNKDSIEIVAASAAGGVAGAALLGVFA
jgi:transcriptional regulator with XRE-family HTH domain